MIDKLRFLVALAEEKHFGLAAKACGVSQPSLSVGIKCLERALDAQLVVRDQRGISCTIGVIMPARDPMTAIARALAAEAREAAARLMPNARDHARADALLASIGP